jgi:glycosyltransferase involved in cell wall biosynthesis
MSDGPRVAIGLPVYNGAATLRDALDSLLAQDYPNCRIVISDNASTDDTAAVARAYAERHGRVEYHRAERNRGAIWNFNRVFELGRESDYFCWAAHDDQRAPTYVSKCVAALEAEPQATLCHSYVLLYRPMVEASSSIESTAMVVDSASPRRRFAATLDRRPWHLLAYGLMRTAILLRTQRYRNFVGADLGLISELALYGTFTQVPEPLFTYRLAADASLEQYFQRLQRVLDPTKKFGKLQSYRVALARAHLQSIRRAPLSPATKLGLALDLVRRFGFSAGTVDELVRIANSLLGVRRVEQLRALKRRVVQR